LQEVFDMLSPLIPYRIYRQGEFPVTEVLSRYTEDEGSVLMGTNSFWQGIDLPGDILRGVIITRLPFGVPDYPPFQARFEKALSMGKNPFYAIQIPDAIIRFKQGFGRLIRRSTDRGIIAVLDSRLYHKGYGKLFLASLPECTLVTSIQDLETRYLLSEKK
jgi:ATP-dependent DNA helicase DinG